MNSVNVNVELIVQVSEAKFDYYFDGTCKILMCFRSCKQ